MNQHELLFDSPEPPAKIQNDEVPRVFNIREVVDQVLEQHQKVLSGDKRARGLSTGIQQLDEMLCGLMPGLHVLASRPSMGKTSLMLGIADHISVEQKVPCLIFSGDLSAHQIVRRMVFSRAGQSSIASLDAATVPDVSEQLRLKQAASEIAESPLYIEDAFDLTIQSLKSIAARYKRDADIGFIVVDHLQLLRSMSISCELSCEHEVVRIVAQLKGLSREMGIPILLLSNLSRRPENRRGKQLGIPRITDLHYAKMIDRFADSITLLYRAQFYAESEEERDALAGKAELTLCKNPNGATGSIEFHFNSDLLRFEEIKA